MLKYSLYLFPIGLAGAEDEMQFASKTIFTSVVYLCISLGSCYRPVIVMHGILSGYQQQQELVDMITGAHQGTKVLNVDAYNDADSVFTPMWEQVDGVYKKIKDFMSEADNGVNMICFSQGNHKHTYIYIYI